MLRHTLRGTVFASTAFDQPILAHKVSQNPIKCLKILCHGCQADAETPPPPPSKAVLGSNQYNKFGQLQCGSTSQCFSHWQVY